jgi:23S rRNA pseudouridine2605 synthase
MDLLKKVKGRVYPVGRLDFNSEGLLLLTNDGEFANRVTSAASEILKTYYVKVKGAPAEPDIQKLRQGVLLDKQRTLPAQVRLLRKSQDAERPEREERQPRTDTGRSRKPSSAVKSKTREGPRELSANSWYEVVLSEGRHNQIRRMFELIGHPVLKLRRVRIGPVTLGLLPPGHSRTLAPEEFGRLLGGKRRTGQLERSQKPQQHRTRREGILPHRQRG